MKEILVFCIILCVCYVLGQPPPCAQGNSGHITLLRDSPVGFYPLNDLQYDTMRNYGTLGDVADGTYINFPDLGETGVHPPPNLQDPAVRFNEAFLGGGILDENQRSEIDFHSELNTLDTSVEIWAKPDLANVVQIIYSNERDGRGMSIIMGIQLDYYCSFNDGDFVIASGLHVGLVGNWNHIVCVYDSVTRTGRLYVDGQLQSETATFDYLPQTSGTTYVASGDGNGGILLGSDFNGVLDELAIFDYVLTDEQIRDHWGNIFLYKFFQEAVGPIGYWRFEGELIDGTIPNDGTLAPDLPLLAHTLIIPGLGIQLPLIGTGALLGSNFIYSNTGATGLAGYYDHVYDARLLPESFTIISYANPQLNLLDISLDNTFQRIVQAPGGAYAIGVEVPGSISILGNPQWACRINTASGTITLTAEATPGEYAHVACTFNATTHIFTMYLNGQFVDFEDLGAPYLRPSSGNFAVGSPLPLFAFDGTIDEVSLYDVALTLELITGIFDSGTSFCELGVNCEEDEICVNYGVDCYSCVIVTAQGFNGNPFEVVASEQRTNIVLWDLQHTGLVENDLVAYTTGNPGEVFFLDTYVPGGRMIDLNEIPEGIDQLYVTAFLRASPESGWLDFTNVILNLLQDFDEDGVEDPDDIDTDNDGILDTVEDAYPDIDTDGDGLDNSFDRDSDGDGLPDIYEVDGDDADGDGVVDGFVDVAVVDGLHDPLLATNGYAELDTDNDGTPDYLDVDSDGDGIPDVVEAGLDTDFDGIVDGYVDLSPRDGVNDTPVDYSLIPDTDGDGIPDWRDPDSDNDGISDFDETGPNGEFLDTDGDGYPDHLDLDSDNDLIPDVLENGGVDANNDGFDDNVAGQNAQTFVRSPLVDFDNDGIPDYLDRDSDGDSIPDISENGFGNLDTDFNGIVDSVAPGDFTFGRYTAQVINPALKDADGDGVPNVHDLDSDNDGSPDLFEARLDETQGGVNNNNIDSNGIDPLYFNTAPLDADGDGVPNHLDIDSDNDGTPDTIENGKPDADSNGRIDPFTESASSTNGFDDTLESSPINPINSDNDTIFDMYDLDSDNDLILDVIEAGAGTDANNDGIYDSFSDSNGNGMDDDLESNPLENPDRDNDGFSDRVDLDSDGDSIPDIVEMGNGALDSNLDGIVDGPAGDFGVNGRNTIYLTGPTTQTPPNSDNDSIPDIYDLDSDNDGSPDLFEARLETTQGGITNLADNNGDGLADAYVGQNPLDADGDGVPNYQDPDSDNDGIPDTAENEIVEDSDFDGSIDSITDINGNGYHDPLENSAFTPVNSDNDSIYDLFDLDSDNDLIPDVIEANGTDADNNGTNDSGTLLTSFPDRDGDGVYDYKDLDSDGDSIPDIQEFGYSNLDGNNDGQVDDPVASNGRYNDPSITTNNILDSDNDGIPDIHDLDSDNDGSPDLFEARLETTQGGIGSALDSNGDGIGDSYLNSTPLDFDNDGVPNYLDIDSDNDGTPDTIENNISDPDRDGRMVITEAAGSENGYDDSLEGLPFTPVNSDNDSNPDMYDIDSDNDLISDLLESKRGDLDGNNDGMIDGVAANDSNNNGMLDSLETTPISSVDTDSDGLEDRVDTDSDGDSIFDIVENGQGAQDTNGDGRMDTPDGSVVSSLVDSDGDGVPDYLDLDSDNDSLTDRVEQTNGDADGSGRTPTSDDTNNDGAADYASNPLVDSDGDGIPNYLDLDSDGDTIPDILESAEDINGDGLIDNFDLNFDGLVDGAVNADGYFVTLQGVVRSFFDNDGDLVFDHLDIDSDNDGVLDIIDNNGGLPADLTDGNLNGWADNYEGRNINRDVDGDGILNRHDLDSDNDGIPDIVEVGYAYPVDNDGLVDGFTDVSPVDGYHDGFSTTPTAPRDTDGDGVADFEDLDSDNDSILDVIEGGGVDNDNDGQIDTPNGPFNNAVPDTDGDGIPDYRDLDSDGDTLSDLFESGLPGESFTYDANNDGVGDLPDTDGDGIVDAFDNDVSNWGTTGNRDPTDTDNDGTPDYVSVRSDGTNFDIDGFLPDGVTDSPFDVDRDGVVDDLTDLDEDGIADIIDSIPDDFGGLGSPKDTDGDGIPDIYDGDVDNDGILNEDEQPGDSDGDGIPDIYDLDSDNDGIPDIVEAGLPDTDNDGLVDGFEDTNGDGVDDDIFANPITPRDSDNDGVPDTTDLDSDNDGVPDVQESISKTDNIVGGRLDGFADDNTNGWADSVENQNTDTTRDTDGDSIPDHLDRDSDNDGNTDTSEAGGADVSPRDGIVDGFTDEDGDGWDDNTASNPLPLPDTDNDGVPDARDLDSDNDTVSDALESGNADLDGDFIVDNFVDNNGDGIHDHFRDLPPIDTDKDGIPDYIDLDTDNDGLSDLFESRRDTHDISSLDSNNDGMADAADSDGDGISDRFDNSPNFGTSGTDLPPTDIRQTDSNMNGIPDIYEQRDDAPVLDTNYDGVIDDNTDVDNDGIYDIVDQDTSNFGGLGIPTPPSIPPTPGRTPTFTPTPTPTSLPTGLQTPSSTPTPTVGTNNNNNDDSDNDDGDNGGDYSTNDNDDSDDGDGNPAAPLPNNNNPASPVPHPTQVGQSLNPDSAEITVSLDCKLSICSEDEISNFIGLIDQFLGDVDQITIVSLQGNILTFMVCGSNLINPLIEELETTAPMIPFEAFVTTDLISVIYDVTCEGYEPNYFLGETTDNANLLSVSPIMSIVFVVLFTIFI